MRIVPRTEYDKRRGEQAGQWLAGCMGAVFTTLPSIAVLPLWFAFIYNFQIVDEHGREDNFACGLICFVAGLIGWVALLVIVGSSGAKS